MQEHFWLTMQDDTEVYVKKWYDPTFQPKAIVQISHGMVEHINRYEELANFLVKKHMYVYGNDHRGHGKTGERQGLRGFLAETDGFAKTTEDLYQITAHIQTIHPNIPIILFGHSMGSFLARKYMQTHSGAIDGVVLSGTGYYSKSIATLGKMIALTQPAKKESQLMNTLSFGPNNLRIKQKKTSFDWLSSDEKAVQAYIDDPNTGYIPTGRFYVDLMTGLIDILNQHKNQHIRSDLPLLFLNGDADPIGDYGKGVWKVAKLYQNVGLDHITMMVFEEGRHELISEVNKEEVFQSIAAWIDHILSHR